MAPRERHRGLGDVEDDVVARVHGRAGRAEGVQGAHDHEGVRVAVEGRRRRDDAVVRVALVVEDGAAARAAADEVDARLWAGGGRVAQEGEGRLDPGVLVAPDDDAGAVGVEEEDGGGGGGVGEEVVLDGEVEVGVGAAGDVDLGRA